MRILEASESSMPSCCAAGRDLGGVGVAEQDPDPHALLGLRAEQGEQAGVVGEEHAAVDQDADLLLGGVEQQPPGVARARPSGAGRRRGSRSPTPTPPARRPARPATGRSRRRRAGPRPGGGAAGRGSGRRSTARSSSGPPRRCRPARPGSRRAAAAPCAVSRSPSAALTLRNPRTFTPHHERETSLVRPQDVLGPRAAYEGRLDQVRLRGDPVPAVRRKVIGMTTHHRHHSPDDHDDDRDRPPIDPLRPDHFRCPCGATADRDGPVPQVPGPRPVGPPHHRPTRPRRPTAHPAPAAPPATRRPRNRRAGR